MRALLTGQQVEDLAREHAVRLAWAIERLAPAGPMARGAFFRFVRDAVEHDLTRTLEGLTVPARFDDTTQVAAEAMGSAEAADAASGSENVMEYAERLVPITSAGASSVPQVRVRAYPGEPFGILWFERAGTTTSHVMERSDLAALHRAIGEVLAATAAVDGSAA